MNLEIRLLYPLPSNLKIQFPASSVYTQNKTCAKLDLMSKVPKNFVKLILLILVLPFIFPFLSNTALAANPATDCKFTFYNASGQDITSALNQNMGDLTVKVESTNIRGNTKYSAQLFWEKIGPANQAFQKFGIDFKNNVTDPPFILSKPQDRWPNGQYELLFYEGTQARPISELNDPNKKISFCKYGFILSQKPKRSCTAVIENSKIDTNTNVTVDIPNDPNDPNGLNEYTCAALNNGGYHIYVDRNPDTVKTYCPGENNRIELGTFKNDSYKVEITRRCGPTDLGCNESDLQCNPITFTVPSDNSKPPPGQKPPPQGGFTCTVSPQPDSASNAVSEMDDIFITSNNAPPKTTFKAYRTTLPNDSPDKTIEVATDSKFSKYLTSSDQGVLSIPLVPSPGNKTPIGKYEAHLDDLNGNHVCYVNYEVKSEKDMAAGRQAALEKCIKDGICSKGGGDPCDTKDNRGPAIKTAIGCVHTSPAEFVKDMMTFIIGISGGLAFLLMLLGAFQMLTSAGNPETLHAGRERLTNAVIGLLIVIFATLLLQIIGLDILQIPGFKR